MPGIAVPWPAGDRRGRAGGALALGLVPLPGDRFVDRHTQRVHISGRRGRFPAQQFRRHVAIAGEVRLPLTLLHGDAQVQHVHQAVLVHQEILGRDVAVHQVVLLVKVAQALAHLAGDLDGIRQGQVFVVPDQLLYRRPVDQVHHQVGPGGRVVAGGVNLHEARMRNRLTARCLQLEGIQVGLAQALILAQEARANHLKRPLHAGVRLADGEDVGHATARYPAARLVAAGDQLQHPGDVGTYRELRAADLHGPAIPQGHPLARQQRAPLDQRPVQRVQVADADRLPHLHQGMRIGDASICFLQLIYALHEGQLLPADDPERLAAQPVALAAI